jgi:hypothetical protein
VRTPEFGKPEGRTADPSTPLPRISCGPWWRWCTHAPFPYRKAHTRPCPVQRGRKSGYAPVGMTILSGNLSIVSEKNCHPDRSVAEYCNEAGQSREGRLKTQPRRSAVPRGTVQLAYHHPGLRPGLLSDVPSGLSAEFSRRLFSPCTAKSARNPNPKEAQGLKPHSFLRLYGTTKVVPGYKTTA